MYNYQLNIEYDLVKAESNFRKHGVSFDEASTALLDDHALVMEDVDSEEENRWILVGLSCEARLLTVIYVVRGEFVRIISARKATKTEADFYA